MSKSKKYEETPRQQARAQATMLRTALKQIPLARRRVYTWRIRELDAFVAGNVPKGPHTCFQCVTATPHRCAECGRAVCVLHSLAMSEEAPAVRPQDARACYECRARRFGAEDIAAALPPVQ